MVSMVSMTPMISGRVIDLLYNHIDVEREGEVDTRVGRSLQGGHSQARHPVGAGQGPHEAPEVHRLHDQTMASQDQVRGGLPEDKGRQQRQDEGRGPGRERRGA